MKVAFFNPLFSRLRIIPAKFQPSSFKTVGGDGGVTDRLQIVGGRIAQEGLAFFLPQKMPL